MAPSLATWAEFRSGSMPQCCGCQDARNARGAHDTSCLLDAVIYHAEISMVEAIAQHEPKVASSVVNVCFEEPESARFASYAVRVQRACSRSLKTRAAATARRHGRRPRGIFQGRRHAAGGWRNRCDQSWFEDASRKQPARRSLLLWSLHATTDHHSWYRRMAKTAPGTRGVLFRDAASHNQSCMAGHREENIFLVSNTFLDPPSV